jgi:hypothetical protein
MAIQSLEFVLLLVPVFSKHLMYLSIVIGYLDMRNLTAICYVSFKAISPQLREIESKIL